MTQHRKKKQQPQADLFGYAAPPTRRRIAYKQTSREAYQRMVPAVTGALDALIVGAVRASMPEGTTCEAIELRINRKHQAVSGNLRHLVERGVIKDSGRLGKVTSGRSAILWVLV